MLIDSPYLPDELDALPSLLAGAGFEPDGLLATHADFDHLLGRLAFPGHDARGGRELRGAPARASRAARSACCATYDAKFYVNRARAARARAGAGAAGARARGDRRPRARAAPCRGPHAPTGWRCSTALRACWSWATTCPTWRSRGSRRAARWRTTAPRSRAWRRSSRRPRPWCPATAPRTTATTTLRLLDEDVDYLDALERGDERPRLPAGRDTKAQREIHAENLTRV